MNRIVAVVFLLAFVLAQTAPVLAQTPCQDCAVKLYAPVVFKSTLYMIGYWTELGYTFCRDEVIDGVPFYVQYVDVVTPFGEKARVERDQDWMDKDGCWWIYWGCTTIHGYYLGYSVKYQVERYDCPPFYEKEYTTIVLSTEIPTAHPPPDTCLPPPK